jgi:CBS domain-containing protein
MLLIRDVMTRDVLTVTPETTLREAAELFARRHVSGAPVVVGEKVVGVVSGTDLLDFIASNPGVPSGGEEPPDVDEWGKLPGWEVGDAPPATYFTELWSDVGAETGERFVDTAGPEWDALSEHTVSEVMTRKVCSLPPDLPATAAADYMRSADMHRVLVLEQGRLAGIITSLDVARAAAEHKLGERRFVFDRPHPGP